MTTLTYTLQDSATMLRRNLRRTIRYPVGPAATVGIPLVFLLLFVFVLGDTLGAGLAGPAADAATTSTTSPPASSCWRWPAPPRPWRSRSPWT